MKVNKIYEVADGLVVSNPEVPGGKNVASLAKTSSRTDVSTVIFPSDGNCYFLLRHAARPIAPRPVPRRRREVGSGIAVRLVKLKFMGTAVPPAGGLT
jgi:hypothetical protein